MNIYATICITLHMIVLIHVFVNSIIVIFRRADFKVIYCELNILIKIVRYYGEINKKR